MRGVRLLIGGALVVAVAGLCAGAVEARQGRQGPSYTRTTCLLGSPEVRAATKLTLAGLDPGIFGSFKVLEPPPPPLSSDHYRGPLWTYATLAGSRDVGTHDLTAEWEARLATGAIGERCSLGLADVQQAVAGGTTRYAGGPHGGEEHSGGSSPAGRVLGAQASRESDARIVAEAEGALASYGLTATSVRVLHPLGPALLVQASTNDVAPVSGRVPQLENALEGGDWGEHPRFEGLYLALDGPDGPLVRVGVATRDAGGFGWVAAGFDSGINHG